MKRWRWVVGATAVVLAVALAAAAWSAAVGNGGPPDLGGTWEFTGRYVVTSVDGPKERGKIQGPLYILQQGPYIELYFLPLNREYEGAVGNRFLSAASLWAGPLPAGLSEKNGGLVGRSILDARVIRRGRRIVGRLKSVYPEDGSASFETIYFRATRIEDTD